MRIIRALRTRLWTTLTDNADQAAVFTVFAAGIGGISGLTYAPIEHTTPMIILMILAVCIPSFLAGLFTFLFLNRQSQYRHIAQHRA